MEITESANTVTIVRDTPDGGTQTVNLNRRKLMDVKPFCSCCHQQLTRLIFPNREYNTTQSFVLHCKMSGRVEPIDDIVKLLNDQDMLDDLLQTD